MDEHEELSGITDPDSDYIVDPITNEDESILYGIYSKIEAYRFYLNDVQFKYKKLASTWLFATFLGIGYILSGYEADIPLHPLLCISFVSIFSSIGLVLLWFLDVGIYQRIIDVLFGENLKLENKYNFLGNSTRFITELFDHVDEPCVHHENFYSLFLIVLLSIIGISLAKYFYPSHQVYMYITIGIILALIFCIKISFRKLVLRWGLTSFRDHK